MREGAEGGRGESALELHQIRSQDDEAGVEVMRLCNRSR